MSTAEAGPTADRTAPRVLLFGHADSGKSWLLGALLQAGETQPEALGYEVGDPSDRLTPIRDEVYREVETGRDPDELVRIPVRLRPRREPGRPPAAPFTVELLDCDGTAAKALMTRADTLRERRERGALAGAVAEADVIVLVVSAVAGEAELRDQFDDFVVFLDQVNDRKEFRREVGGFPIVVAVAQCDRLARPGDTRAEWEARAREARTRVRQQLARYLRDTSPAAGIQSPYLPFGSVDLSAHMVAVRKPPLADEPLDPGEPYRVADLFRVVFTAATRHRDRVRSSRRRLLWTVWAVGLVVWGMLAGIMLVAYFQPPPADPGLTDRVREFRLREPPAAVRLADANLARGKRVLAGFRADPGFWALPDDLREFVDGGLREVDDYQAYRAKLAATPAPADARTLDDLKRVEATLTTALALPAEYTWADTEAARLRDKWLADVPAVRAAANDWANWYRGLYGQAVALRQTESFDGRWREAVAGLDGADGRRPFDPAAVIPGSGAVPQPRGGAVTYRVPAEFDEVYQARRDWEFARDRLRHLRDLADALGLTPDPGDPGRRALVIPPPGPGVDSAALAGERLAALRTHFPKPPVTADGRLAYPEWELANFPPAEKGARSRLAERLRESADNGARHVRGLVRAALGTPVEAGDTPEGWAKVAAALDGPPFADWGLLLRLLARLEDPSAAGPVADLAAFLKRTQFDLDPERLALTLPLAVGVPAGPLTVTVTPRAGGEPTVRTFQRAGEGVQQGVTVVYPLAPDAPGPLVYRPGDALRAELPVRAGDQRLALVWDAGGTQTFQFDRLAREPKLVRDGTALGPATGAALAPAPGSALPRVPVLLPDLRP